MKFIVVQKEDCDLEALKNSVARLDQRRSEDILFSRDFEEILLAVAENEEVFIVSGQIILLDGRCRLGTELAQLVKRFNPNAFFCIYSVMAEVNECVDAVIPKSYSDGLLERILTSEFCDLLVREKFKQAFPTVRVL